MQSREMLALQARRPSQSLFLLSTGSRYASAIAYLSVRHRSKSMGRDEERLAAEERGEERPEKPRTLSAAYLEQSLDALYAAGNPAVLFEKWREKPPKNKTAEAFMVLTARRTHLAQCRTATLFAALSAEAYVNEFLAAHLKGNDLKAVDRMSPVDKYVLGTKLAYGESLFFRDREPFPVINELFKLRNQLVHPKPGFGPAGPLGPSGDFEQLFPPTRVAELRSMLPAPR